MSVKTANQTALSKNILVATNDPRQPQVTLHLTAMVVPEFALSERAIYFGSVPSGKEVVKELWITIPPDKPVRVLSAESTDKYVTVRLDAVQGTSGKKVKLVAVQQADAKKGYHFGMIVVKTSSPLTPEIKIPVRGIVTAASQN